MSDPQKFTIRKSNGTEWVDLYPETTGDQVIIDTPIPVMLTGKFGSLNPGDTIPANTSIDGFIRRLVQEQIPPNYISPTIGIEISSGNPPAIYEAGTSITAQIRALFTKNDAGNMTELIIYKNDEIFDGGNTELDYSVSDTFVVGDDPVSLKASAIHTEGEIKNDNFGEPYPDTHILSGTVISELLIFSGMRSYFYGSDTGSLACSTSADVRSLDTKSTNVATEGMTFSIPVLAGDRRITIAYPDTLRDLTSIRYLESGNDDIKPLFTKTLINVEGANGFTAKSYKVYTMIASQPFPANMTFNVII